MTGTGRPVAQRRLAAGGVTTLVIGVLSFTPPGAAAVAVGHRFLDFYAGVFSLVALSLTVMGGLAATDRLILLIRHRVLLQAIHRATAAAAIGFLAVHILMKLVSGHVRLLDTVVPFLAHHRAGYVGLGTLSAYLMIIAAWTGLTRGRFAELSRPGLWRVLHCSAYAAWPVAIVHGLKSGRTAAGWVTASYVICLVAVAMASLIRLSVHWGRQRAAAGSTTGSLPRIGASRRPAPAVPIATSGPPRPVPVSPSPTATMTTTGSIPRVIDPLPPPPPVMESPRAAHPAGTRPNRQARRRAADTAPPPARTFESVSDEEFWAFMRGERS